MPLTSFSFRLVRMLTPILFAALLILLVLGAFVTAGASEVPAAIQVSVGSRDAENPSTVVNSMAKQAIDTAHEGAGFQLAPSLILASSSYAFNLRANGVFVTPTVVITTTLHLPFISRPE